MASSRVTVDFSINLFFKGCDLGKRRQKRDFLFAKSDIFPANPGVLGENGRTSPFVQPQMSPKLEDVMGQADEVPFSFHLFQAPEEKGPDSSLLFDLSENRLYRLFSLGVGLLPHFCLEFTQCSVNDRGVVGNTPTGRRFRRVAVLLALTRDERFRESARLRIPRLPQ